MTEKQEKANIKKILISSLIVKDNRVRLFKWYKHLNTNEMAYILLLNTRGQK